MTKQVFISYSSNDLHTAEKVCLLLEVKGISCWIAPRDVIPGTNYAEEIIKAIENAVGLVLICSRHTSDSVHVISEVEYAFSQRKVIFPVRMDEVELGKALKYFLGSSHWLTAWNAPIDDCVKRLAGSIRMVIGRESIASDDSANGDMKWPINAEPQDHATQAPDGTFDGATEGTQPHLPNLPAQATPLIGRKEEITTVTHLLRRADVRLVTLTGPGGIGKTRLGLEAAAHIIDEYKDGVFFVGLDTVSNFDLVVGSIARIVGLREGGDLPIEEILKGWMKGRQTRLIRRTAPPLPCGPSCSAVPDIWRSIREIRIKPSRFLNRAWSYLGKQGT